MPSILARCIVTGDTCIGPARVDIDVAGNISAIAPTSETTADVTLVPGFVDLQVNGIDDIDVVAARGDDWHRLGNLLLDQGVTSWCPTLVTNALGRFAAPLARIAEAQQQARIQSSMHTQAGMRAAAGTHIRAGSGTALPTIIGAHLEGPFIGGAPGAHPRDLIAPISLEWLAALPSVVCLITLAAELPDATEATALLSARGVMVSIGHSTPSVADVDALVRSGARMITHLFNGMSGVHHREPGLASVALVDDRLTVGLIADLVHVERRAIELAFRAKPADRIVLVTDAVAWRSGAIGAGKHGIAITMREGAPCLADGTLAGSAVTMDQAVRNVVQVCGIPIERAAMAASTNAARLMGCTDRGEIAVGRRADLVALDPDLAIAGVWLAGVQVR